MAEAVEAGLEVVAAAVEAAVEAAAVEAAVEAAAVEAAVAALRRRRT